MLEDMPRRRGIEHQRIEVESHKNSSRAERAIRTLREGLAKDKNGTWEE
jgi:hypothetical protein